MKTESDVSITQSPWKRFFTGVACLAIPVALIAWWIYVAETTMGGQAARVERFLNIFPSFLQNAQLVTWIQLAFTGAAFMLFFSGLVQKTFHKALSIAMLGFSGLIGLWLLFTLM
ncbi:hypothetical protein G3570_02415 [Balneolaceae bacterium YR4-1]|uniref:Uncharacterized protein n=1 Tax=Halalkalibaculum roseum TaxID=2709311 RepID=A0A6M1SRM5_9BACT|nr:hypothetical protein [Halalkalibaculum roseum]NGP75470.1 hypothetical protein [Halalkalibaculum roseum]